MKTIPTGHSVDTPWHLALCRPNQNHIALRHLNAAGIAVFMPRHHTFKRWRGRQIDCVRPVFGGYVFFSTDPAAPRWLEVTRMPGIGSLVGSGARGPVQVPSSVVTVLMLRCDVDGCLIPDTAYSKGKPLPMTNSPFAGFVGTVEQIDTDRRIHMLLEIMGTQNVCQRIPSFGGTTRPDRHCGPT